jgi:hypothetical protein
MIEPGVRDSGHIGYPLSHASQRQGAWAGSGWGLTDTRKPFAPPGK